MPAHLRNKFSWATGRPVSHWCPRQFMAAGGLHQRYSTCGISARPPRDAKKCHDQGVEERPNGITVHSLPPTERRAALIRTQQLGSPLPKGHGGARAIRPEQAKQQKRREDYLTF